MFLALESGGRTSHLLSERGRHHFWRGAAGLSIKSFRGGRALYDAGGGSFAVDERSYLVLNEDQPYAITVESRTPVKSFCVFFGRGMAEEASRGVTAPVAALLDDPLRSGAPVSFFERTYTHDEVLSPALFHLRDALAGGAIEIARLEELLRGLLERLVQVHRQVRVEADALPSLRGATREELYRRLHRARDHAAASFTGRVALHDLAQVACLSPSHFLRTFRQLFGETPHQYLTGRRLARARDLLSKTSLPVTEICLAVGFESLGSFSALFRRQTGVSPNAYRRKQKSDFEEARETPRP